MGTKTQKSQTNGYIETIIHDSENGGSGHADHNSDALDGYETDQAGEMIDGEGNEEPTPITTEAEEAARADEFPAVIQAGMWVQLIKDGVPYCDAYSGDIGKIHEDTSDSLAYVLFSRFVEPESRPDLPEHIWLPLHLKLGDSLPDFLEQANAPEPAFDEIMKHTKIEVHPALYMTLPDSTPLDDLDGENAEPSEAETVYTTAMMTEPSAEASKRYVPRDVLETLGDIYDLSAEAQRISFKLDGAKAVVKELREELDVANSKLRSAALALKWSREPEPELFRQRDIDSDTDSFSAAESQVSQSTPTPAAPDESWRSISIDELNLPGKIPEQLREHHPSLDTIGAIVDFVNTPFTYLTDVKGIGQGKAEKIADALEAFWKNRNAKPTDALDPTSTEQGAAAFDSGMTLDDNPHPRGSSDLDEWRAGFKARAGMGDGDEAVGDEDL